MAFSFMLGKFNHIWPVPGNIKFSVIVILDACDPVLRSEEVG